MTMEQRGSAGLLACGIIAGSIVLWVGVASIASRPSYAPPVDAAPPTPVLPEPPRPEPVVLEPEPEEPPLAPLTPDEFKRLFVATQSSAERRALVRRLSPVGPHADDSFDLLVEFVLKQQDWFMREAAIEVLARHADALMPRFERLVGGEPMVAEGILLALGDTGDRKHAPFLIEQLAATKKWKVRRAAARALGLLGDPVAVEPLLAVWADEEKHLVVLAIREALSLIIGAPVTGPVAPWRAWWTLHGLEDAAHRPAPEAVRILQRTVDGIRFHVRLRGEGPFGVLVLPELGLSNRVLEPALEPLDPHWRMALVTMPLRDELGLPSRGGPTPYPVGRVADALRKLKDELARDEPAFQNPCGLMAQGLSGWIAMMIAATHPQTVRRMVLVAVPAGTKDHLEGIQRLERVGVDTRHLELEHYAPACLPGWSASPGREDTDAAARVRWTSRVADYRDLQLAWWLGPRVEETDGRVRFQGERFTDGLKLPDFTLFLLDRTLTPTLVITGARSVVTSAQVGKVIAMHYGSAGRFVEFANSDQLPMLEENEKFCEIMQRFTTFKPATPATEASPGAEAEPR